MADVLILAGQVAMALIAVKAIIWGCGGPTLRGWNDVVRRQSSAQITNEGSR